MLQGTSIMQSALEDEELPLPLLRRSVQRATIVAEEDIPLRRGFLPSERGDRLGPATAGAFVGLVAGAAGLGVVHAMHLGRIGAGTARTALAWGIPEDAALPIAYVAAALGGAVIGAGFAAVTQHLRRLVPLLVWAVVFFVSLTMLLLAGASTYGHALDLSMAPAILAASGVFALVVAFQLPLRRRS